MNFFMPVAIVASLIVGVTMITSFFAITRKKKKLLAISLVAMFFAAFLLINDYRAMMNSTKGTIVLRDEKGNVVNIVEDVYFHKDLLGKSTQTDDKSGMKITYTFYGENYD